MNGIESSLKRPARAAGRPVRADAQSLRVEERIRRVTYMNEPVLHLHAHCYQPSKNGPPHCRPLTHRYRSSLGAHEKKTMLN